MHASPDQLNATFAALADPTRRAILARLAAGEATVKELSEPFAMSGPAVSKHLGCSSAPGSSRVAATPSGVPAGWRRHRSRTSPSGRPSYRRFWDASYERLDDYLQHLKEEEPNMAATSNAGATDLHDAVGPRDRGDARRRRAARARVRGPHEPRARAELDARPERLDDARVRDRPPAGRRVALRLAPARTAARWRCAASTARSSRPRGSSNTESLGRRLARVARHADLRRGGRPDDDHQHGPLSVAPGARPRRPGPG